MKLKPKWKWLCALAAATLFAAPAFSQDPIYAPTFQWTPPSEFESGAALDPQTDLMEFRLYCTPTILMQTIVQLAPPYSWTAPGGLFPPGDYTCEMTAVASAANGGLESGPSNSASVTVSPDRPAPIVIFTIS